MKTNETTMEDVGREAVGRTVKQMTSDPGFENHIGRGGKVVDSFVDEKRALHVKTEDGTWCPARHLKFVDG